MASPSRFPINIKTTVQLAACLSGTHTFKKHTTVSVILTVCQMLPLAIDSSGSQRIPKGAINSIIPLRQDEAGISDPISTR